MRKNIKIIVLAIFVVAVTLFSIGCSKVDKAKETFNSYVEKWASNDYTGMYQYLSSDSKSYISEDIFIERYKNIYDAIEAEKLVVKLGENMEENEGTITIPFEISMETVAGNITANSLVATLVKEEKEFKLKWDESFILPNMMKDDKVRVEDYIAQRGRILDRDGNALADNGIVKVVGIHPSVFDETNREEKIKDIAKILDIDESSIVEKLDNNSNPEHFVEIATVLSSDTKLLQLFKREAEGILVNDKKSRVYNGGEAFGRLVGYIGPITAEELEANAGKGYYETSLIGKAGLEQVYEETLKGKDGGEIYLERGSEKITIAKVDAEQGKDVKVAIDSALQSKVYGEMAGEMGAATAVNPKTGEVLAMVSSPSYDSNMFITYITNTKKAEREAKNYSDEVNRFTKVYSPGSTMKLLTASIGLENGVINDQDTKDIVGMSWQKDSSWGDYKITRVIDPQKSINLRDAANYSDNIYFAQVALDLGGEKFINGIKKFGIGEEINFEYPLEQSQISNDGTITSEIALADTGYGQGQIMVTPLNMALVYSALGNNGDIMLPRLLIEDGRNPEVWKKSSIPVENVPVLIKDFSALINDEDGTARDGKVNGFNIAAKTGTAEIKQSQDDENGKENGWFVAVNTDDSKISLAMIIEDVKGRGGSHVTVPKVRNIMEYYLTK